jgi:DNA-binding helix-hairpin-helix protein with protein kinase domain
MNKISYFITTFFKNRQKEWGTTPAPMSQNPASSGHFPNPALPIAGETQWWNNTYSDAATNLSDAMKVYDPKGKFVILKEPIKQGGEGAIYNFPETDRCLIKIYNADIRSNLNKMSDISNRLADMVNMKEFCKLSHLAWPRLVVYDSHDSNRKIIGFAMNKVQGHSFRSLHYIVNVNKYFPGWNRINLAETSLDFVRKLKILHANGILINDFNPSNIFINPKDGKVNFLDCNCYQVVVPGKKRIHRSGAYFPTHCAPEILLNPDLLKKPRNVEQDLFGAAITIFQTLMLGLHPYSRVGGEDPEENLRSGICALGTDSRCRLPVGHWFNRWSWLPYNLKDCFVQTFRKEQGHVNPSLRPKLNDWENALKEYVGRLKGNNPNLIPDLTPVSPKPSARKGKKTVI